MDAMCTRIWWVRPVSSVQRTAQPSAVPSSRSISVRAVFPGWRCKSTTAMRSRLRGSRPIGASTWRAAAPCQGLCAMARYWRDTSRAAISCTSASIVARVRATTISPLVSRSSRWTMPARGSSAACGSSASRPLSSVPLQWPGAGCTTSPAGLSMIRRCASSYTTRSAIGSALKAWLCGVGRSSICPASPTRTVSEGLVTTRLWSTTAPASINCCR